MWYENLDGSTRFMIFIPIESSDMNKIFQARHHSIEHDFRGGESKTSFIIFEAKIFFSKSEPGFRIFSCYYFFM